MSEMTYTCCPICKGTLRIVITAASDMSAGALDSGAREEAIDCICTRGKTPGWSVTGITLGQIERAVKAEAELKTRGGPAHEVTAQELSDCGLNPFALKLLLESYTRHPKPVPVTFLYQGFRFTLSKEL